LAVFDAAVEEIAARVMPVYRANHDWLERIRASLLALLDAFDERPETARLLVNDSIAWGPEVRERRGELLETLAEALEEGRGEVAAAWPGHDRSRCDVDPVRPLPETTGENLVGASLSWLHTRLAGESGPLVELAPSLMSMIAHPYLGAEAAQGELERPLTGLGAEVVTREGEGDTPSPTTISRLRATPS
jgi:hypothetical protein